LDQIAAMLKKLAPHARVYGFPDGVSAVGAAGADADADACVCTPAAGAPADPSRVQGYFLDIANTKGVHTYRAKVKNIPGSLQ